MNLFAKLFATAAVAASAVASPAMAGPYINLGIGTGFGTDIDGDVNGIDFDTDARTTVGGGVGLGYEFGNIRLEGKVTLSTADVDSVTVGGVKYDVDGSGYGWGIGVDLEYDFNNDSKFTPYVGVGVGTSWADDADDNAYGFSSIAGVAYAASEKIDLYGEIAYGFTPEQEIDGVDYNSYGEFGATVGLRFAF